MNNIIQFIKKYLGAPQRTLPDAKKLAYYHTLGAKQGLLQRDGQNSFRAIADGNTSVPLLNATQSERSLTARDQGLAKQLTMQQFNQQQQQLHYSTQIAQDPAAVFELYSQKTDIFRWKIDEKIRKVLSLEPGAKIDQTLFAQYIEKYKEIHQKCGDQCSHIRRFYEKLGFNKLSSSRQKYPII